MPERMIGRVMGGQYRIEGHLGSGGFGDVFRAVQETTGQVVALKVLKPRYGNGAPSMDRQLARFRREMRVCAELHHPHIVRLIDSGETERGLLFSVFEYVPGMTLAELLGDKGALTVRLSIELMTQVLDALICAHGRKVIHRDLKPSNIMVSSPGSRPQTTILDFGISAFLDGMFIDEFRSLTVTREILGTPAYAAPEQLRGETPSMKSDLYAWGLVFLECILGRRVFDGASSMEVAHRQLSGEAVWLPERLQKHWLGVLLRWVLEKDVDRRAGDGALVVERLLEKRSLSDLVDANGYFIDESANQRIAPVAAGGDSPTPSVGTAGSVSVGERRQVTALCCAIGVGEIDGPHTPELLDQALRDVQLLCLQVARRFGGFPAGNLGGQVLVYFGFPRASDTDARRSAVVALEISHEVRRRNESSEIPVEVRIGLHTGVVTTLGREQRPTSPVFGLTPGRAIQLALQAPLNTILVSAESFSYLAASFELQPLTSGQRSPIYTLVAESRAESATVGARAPFVGRETELTAMRGAWRRAQNEQQGGTVVVLGEAGLGKSRLARELRQSLEDSRSRWIEARCLPEAHNSALYPIIDLLLQELNLSPSAGADGSRRLEARLRDLQLDADHAMPLLCPWLGLPLTDPHQAPLFSPQKQKSQMLALLVELVVAIGEASSAPILIEDLHWADPTTLEYVDLLIKRVAKSRCLLLLTARPDAAEVTWDPEQVQILKLKSLDRADVLRMIEGLSGPDALSTALLEDVVQRADGIPLFAEEIVRFLKESSGQRAMARRGGPAEMNVPAGLLDLLTGRLDRLGRAKDTAQVAAAIGREFDYRLLASVLSGDEAALLADLEKMVSADILTRRRHVDNPVYIFRHVLIRDAAYQSLLHKNQQHLHRQIAETLVEKFPDVAEAQPEIVASHYERAGLVRESIDQWLRAGKRGLERAANRETIVHLRRALALLDGIADPSERNRRELDLQLTLAPALMAIQGWASPETGAACTRARDLCHALGDRRRLFSALWGLWTFQFVGGDLDAAQVTAEQTLTRAAASQDRKIELAAHHAVGFTGLYRGEFLLAQKHGEQGIALYDLPLEREIIRTSQLSSTGACAYFRAASLWMLGYPVDAEEGLAFMYRTAHELGHAPSLASVMGFALFLHHYQQDVERTHNTSEELFALSRDQEFHNWLAVSFIYRAWARAKQGDLERGISEIRQGIEQFRSIGARLILVGVYAMLGEALLLAGRTDETLAALAEGMAEAKARGEHLCESELHRLRGEALVGIDSAEAEASFNAALRIAQQQQARSFSLRSALGLARLWSVDRKDEAVVLLQRECEWFTQGFETRDFREARELLDALGAT